MVNPLQKFSSGSFLFFVLAITSALTIHVKAQGIMQVAKDNFTSFTSEKKYSDFNKLLLITPAQYQNHPDFGKCFTDNNSWYEQLDKRTLKTRSYVDINDPHAVITQYDYDNLNYIDENGWLCGIDTRLKKTAGGWAVNQQETPTFLYHDGSTAIGLEHKQVMRFNKNVEFNGEPISVTDFSVGDNGMKVKNAATNTDKIIRFKRDEIETDYLINKPLKLSRDLLISEDIILPAGYTISENTSNNAEGDDKGSLEVKNADGKVMVELKSPFCYDNLGNARVSSYRINKQQDGYRLEIVVSSSWLNDAARKYPVTIDPIVTGPTSTWSGGVIDACYFPGNTSGTGTGTITVTILPKITVTHFYVSGSYTTFSPYQVQYSGIAFYTTCGRNPAIAGQWWSDLSTASGTVYVTNEDMLSTLGYCDTPSCDTQKISLTMAELQADANVACSTTYSEFDPAAGFPFQAYIVGHTIEDSVVGGSAWSVTPTSLCGNDCSLTLSVLIHNGVAPYTVTHPWASGSVTTGSYNTTTYTSIGSATLPLTNPNCPTTCGIITLLSVPAPTIVDACGDTVAGLSAKTITVKPIPVATANPPSESICSGTNVNIALSSCIGGTTYSWTGTNGSSGSGTPINNSPTNIGTVPITVTYTITPSVGGCTGIPITVPVTVNPYPTITASPSPASYCPGGNSILTASGGSTYTWSPATNLSATSGAIVTANPATTTTYTITGTNSSGCSATNMVTVMVNSTPTITASPSPASYCPGGNSILTASGGSTYTWSPSTNLSATSGTIVTANPATTTTYTITGTNSSGCSATNMVTVMVNSTPTITASPSPASYCPGGNSILTASGGSTYTWSPATNLSVTSGATVTANPATTTIYTVTGTNASGCSATNTVTVTVNPTPTITASPSPASYCPGGNSILTASGGSTYTWSPATNLSATSGAIVTANPAATTTYTVTGTNSSGCSATGTVTVTVNSNPIITAFPSPASYCPGGNSILTASGGSTYTWSPATNLSATSGAVVTANPAATTTYTVTGTNANGCVNTGTVTVAVNPTPTITASPSPASYCPGGNSILTASGGSTYTWSPATNLSATSGAIVTANPSTTTTYTVTGTSGLGCTGTAIVTVTVNPTPIITASPSPASYCPGGNSILTASGGSTYTWSPATNLSATSGAIVTANPAATTTYTVTGTNSSGCSATNTVTVTVNPTPTITASPSPASYCPGGNSILTALGGSTYTWSPATNLSATSGAIVTANPVVTTTYTVTGTNSSGCSATNTVTITVNPNLTIKINTPSPICNGESATLTASGGITYVWVPSTGLNATTGGMVVANPTVTTVYSVTGTGDGNCISTVTDTVTVIAVTPLTIQPQDTSVCLGQSITLSVPVSGSGYTWSPALILNSSTGDSVIATPLVITTFTVTGKNSSGCTVSGLDTVNVTHGPNIPVITKSSNVLISSATQSNQWVRNDTVIDGATNETYKVTAVGCYSVITKNLVNGCSSTSDTVCVTTIESSIDQLSINSDRLSIYPNPTTGEISVNINSSVEDIKDWNLQITDVLGRTVYAKSSLNYNNDIDLSNLPGGVYFITVINKMRRAVVPVVRQN
jgi:hypothetical protein